LTGSDATVIGGPYQYSGTIPDVSALPSYINLAGPTLGQTSAIVTSLLGGWSRNFQAPFDMTITFSGAAGTHPSIELAGDLTGTFTSRDLPQSAWGGGGDVRTEVDSSFHGSVTSAKLQGWAPDSGIPMSAIAPLLNTATYSFTQSNVWVNLPDPEGIYVEFKPPGAAETPEPATVLLYLVAIAGLGVRRGARLWRGHSTR
jgi:hypothetical protein